MTDNPGKPRRSFPSGRSKSSAASGITHSTKRFPSSVSPSIPTATYEAAAFPGNDSASAPWSAPFPLEPAPTPTRAPPEDPPSPPPQSDPPLNGIPPSAPKGLVTVTPELVSVGVGSHSRPPTSALVGDSAAPPTLTSSTKKVVIKVAHDEPPLSICLAALAARHSFPPGPLRIIAARAVQCVWRGFATRLAVKVAVARGLLPLRREAERERGSSGSGGTTARRVASEVPGSPHSAGTASPVASKIPEIEASGPDGELGGAGGMSMWGGVTMDESGFFSAINSASRSAASASPGAAFAVTERHEVSPSRDGGHGGATRTSAPVPLRGTVEWNSMMNRYDLAATKMAAVWRGHDARRRCDELRVDQGLLPRWQLRAAERMAQEAASALDFAYEPLVPLTNAPAPSLHDLLLTELGGTLRLAQCALVVACDGARSAVRAQEAANRKAIRAGMLWVKVDAKLQRGISRTLSPAEEAHWAREDPEVRPIYAQEEVSRAAVVAQAMAAVQTMALRFCSQAQRYAFRRSCTVLVSIQTAARALEGDALVAHERIQALEESSFRALLAQAGVSAVQALTQAKEHVLHEWVARRAEDRLLLQRVEEASRVRILARCSFAFFALERQRLFVMETMMRSSLAEVQTNARALVARLEGAARTKLAVEQHLKWHLAQKTDVIESAEAAARGPIERAEWAARERLQWDARIAFAGLPVGKGPGSRTRSVSPTSGGRPESALGDPHLLAGHLGTKTIEWLDSEIQTLVAVTTAADSAGGLSVFSVAQIEQMRAAGDTVTAVPHASSLHAGSSFAVPRGAQPASSLASPDRGTVQRGGGTMTKPTVARHDGAARAVEGDAARGEGSAPHSRAPLPRVAQLIVGPPPIAPRPVATKTTRPAPPSATRITNPVHFGRLDAAAAALTSVGGSTALSGRGLLGALHSKIRVESPKAGAGGVRSPPTRLPGLRQQSA